MSVAIELEKYLSLPKHYKLLNELKSDRAFTVDDFLELTYDFLSVYKAQTPREWAQVLFDYALYKSFPHKQTQNIESEFVLLYESLLNLLSEINGSFYFNYDIEGSTQEIYDFINVFKSNYIYEIMQLDMYLTEHNTIEHVLGVTDVAMHIAQQLKKLGMPIDVGVVLGAALGHDFGKYGVMAKDQNRVPYLHYYYTELWYKKFNLDKIGHIATNHSTWDLELETLPIESLVLIYSDFRVKNKVENGKYKMTVFTLDESFQVILDKLDNVDETKENRYKRVYSKLKDFENFMLTLGIDTTLNGTLEKKEHVYLSLLRGEDIVKWVKHIAIENNIFLMSYLMNQDKFLSILEQARGETNWRILSLYLEILKEYSTYLTQRQKIMVLHFLKDLLLHKEEDIRYEAASLIGKIIAYFDEEYRKELPNAIELEKPLETSSDIFDQFLESILRPNYKLLDSQTEWMYNLKLIVKSLFEHSHKDRYYMYFDKLNRFYKSSYELTLEAQFYLLQTITSLPIFELPDHESNQLYDYIMKMVASKDKNLRLSALDRSYEVVNKYFDTALTIPLRYELEMNTDKSPFPAENYIKYTLALKIGVNDSVLKILEQNYLADEANVSELYLENLKTATSWTTKKINIDILYDKVKQDPHVTGIHTAIHLCNLLKVSAIERVRNYSGHTLLNIIPMLSPEQRNDVAIELLRALEMDSYQFTKFIPEHLGELILYLPPKELDELLDDVEQKIKVSRPQTILLLLNTIGTSIINYPIYAKLFPEGFSLNIQRLNKLLGFLLVPITSYHIEVKTEALRVLTSMLFGKDKLDLEKKSLVFSRVAKKILTLIEDTDESNITFYNNAASLNHLYRFISDFEFHEGELTLGDSEDVVFFPGSFDPFSLGHREIAREIRKLGFEVYLAVDEFSWSKRTEPHQLRRNIINMSIAKEDGIYLFPKEIPINIGNDKDIKLLKSLFGDREVYLAVGSDVVVNASAYKKGSEILKINHILFDRRTNSNDEDENIINIANKKLKGEVLSLSLPPRYEDISSSQIRANIDQNRDISRLIDPMASDYIYNYGLYLREPLYKSLIETKTIDVEVYRTIDSDVVELLINCFGEDISLNGLKELANKLSFRLILVRDLEKDDLIGFSAFYWVRHSRLYDEFKDQEITSYIRNNAKGRTAFISCLYAKENSDEYMDIVLNETLSIALNRDYNYALYSNTTIKGENKLAEEFIIMQGFVRTPYYHEGSPLYMVDMNNPISLNLDLEGVLKPPYNSDIRVLNEIWKARKKLKRALADLYPGELLISFNRDMVNSKLIQKVCDSNSVSVNDNNKKTLGNNMCVPFGIILNNSIIPNTVTKTLHTERIFAHDIQSFHVGEFPYYLSLEEQAKTIKSFNRPVILLDDLLHKGYRIKMVEPILRAQGIEITKLIVGILSGSGREIADIRNLNIDSAYFVPNLRLWFNESSQYPFLGGDMVEQDYSVSNLIPSINFILPYVSPRFIKDVPSDFIMDLSEISLNNSKEIFKVIERVYQEINEKNLTVKALGEVIYTPRYPDLERSINEKRFLSPSAFLEMDIDYLKRLEYTLRGHNMEVKNV